MNAADAAHQRRGVPLTVWNYGVVVFVFDVLLPLVEVLLALGLLLVPPTRRHVGVL